MSERQVPPLQMTWTLLHMSEIKSDGMAGKGDAIRIVVGHFDERKIDYIELVQCHLGRQ